MEEKMGFEEFKRKLAEKIADHLPDELKNGEIRFSEVTKSGIGPLTGMTILTEDSMVSPCIYINSAYEDHTKYGASISSVAASLG